MTSTTSNKCCSFCHCVGHNIRTCTDESARILKNDFVTAYRYSLAYQTGPFYLAWYLRTLVTHSGLRLLASQFSVPGQIAGIRSDQFYPVVTARLIEQVYTSRLGNRVLKDRILELFSTTVGKRNLLWVTSNLVRIFSRRYTMSPFGFSPCSPFEINLYRDYVNDITLQYEVLLEEEDVLLTRVLNSDGSRFMTQEYDAFFEVPEHADIYQRMRDIQRTRNAMNMVTRLASENPLTMNLNLTMVQDLSKSIPQDESCPICLSVNDETNTDVMLNMVMFDCNHTCCSQCAHSYFKSLTGTKTPACSLCRAPIERILFQETDEGVNRLRTLI
jgi:Zinc finger, C3HC4 type (RING finger)